MPANPKSMKSLLRTWALLTIFASGTTTLAVTKPEDFKPQDPDLIQIKDLPRLGKWMITPDFEPAHWLGALFEKKKIREPINIIIIDDVAKTADEAKARFLKAATDAGFPVRKGHSSGYFAWIGDKLYSQVPETPSHAFSDEPYEFNNNHGRFFGPYSEKSCFLFVGSLSRESVAPFSNPKHQYVSFNRARDKFSDAMNLKTSFKLDCFVSMENDIIGNPDTTTGDHDGQAVVLRSPVVKSKR